VRNSGVKGALIRKRSYVKFIDHVVLEWQTLPTLILPIEMQINDLGRPVHSFGLESGRRVRALLAAIQAIKVEAARGYAIHANLKISSLGRSHGYPTGVFGPEQLEVEALGSGRPHLEGATVSEIVSS